MPQPPFAEGRKEKERLSEFAHSDTEVIWNGNMFTILVAFGTKDKGQYVDADDLTVSGMIAEYIS